MKKFASVLVVAVLVAGLAERADAAAPTITMEAVNGIWEATANIVWDSAKADAMMTSMFAGDAVAATDLTAGAYMAVPSTAGWAFFALPAAGLGGWALGQEIANQALGITPPTGLSDTFRYIPAANGYGSIEFPIAPHTSYQQMYDLRHCRVPGLDTEGNFSTYTTTFWGSYYWGLALLGADVTPLYCSNEGSVSCYSASLTNQPKVYGLSGQPYSVYQGLMNFKAGSGVPTYCNSSLGKISGFTPRLNNQAGRAAAVSGLDPATKRLAALPRDTRDLDNSGEPDANNIGGALTPGSPPNGSKVYFPKTDGTLGTYTAAAGSPTPAPVDAGPGTYATPTPVPTPTPAPTATPVPTAAPTATPWAASAEPSSNPEATPSVVPTPPVALPPGPVSSENFVTHPISILRTKFPFDWATDAVVGLPADQDMYWVAWQGQVIEGHAVERTYDLNWTKPIWRAIVVVGVIGLCVTAFLLL